MLLIHIWHDECIYCKCINCLNGIPMIVLWSMYICVIILLSLYANIEHKLFVI